MANPFTSALRATQGVAAYTKIMRDPLRLDEVFSLADTLSDRETLQSLHDQFARHAAARAAIESRYRVQIRIDELARLPAQTLGREFAEHMRRNGLDPASIPALPAENSLAYVKAHLYDTHDIWHVVTGFDTDVAGEGGLQAFYSAQFNGPFPLMVLSALLMNTAMYARDDQPRRMQAIHDGWALGSMAAPFFGTRWDELWSRDLAGVRRELGIVPTRSTPRVGPVH